MRLFLRSVVCFFCVLISPLFAEEVEREVKTWANNPGAFRSFEEEIAKNHDLNYLSFSGVKLVEADRVDSPQLLIDGRAGQLGGHGRVAINGNPSRIVYYLGAPRSICEIRICTGNIDQRGNQDFEIRLLDNSEKPGERPEFSGEPTLTSGDKVLGNNGGGVMSIFREKNEKKLFGGKSFDWIEVKMWRTYPNGRSGEPAKSGNRSDSWGAAIEIQLLADPDDPNVFSSESERQLFLAKRRSEKFAKDIAELGTDISLATKNPGSLRLAIEDLALRFPGEFDAEKYRPRMDAFEREFAALDSATPDYEKNIDLAKRFARFRREVLLSNPLLNFEELLFRKASNPGLEANWISNCARWKGNYGNALLTLNPKNSQGETRTVIEGPQGSFVGDITLHWDADKMLITALAEDKTWQVFEVNLDGTGLRQITPSLGTDIDNVEGCYVPDGSFVFISSASMMGVPCIDGSSPVGNVYRLEADGKTMRQLTFEQDQDWCPVLMPNGRILYLRWEYTDIAHYFTRILFSMNPDGTNQLEHYGSNSYWPNSLFYAKPIPDHPTKFVGIVSGHHGVARMGELVVFDPAKGRKEADGVVQRIPGYQKSVEPIIEDELVNNSWPKFLFPYPLNENYFIASGKLDPDSPWGLYLVDVFDNILLLREEPGYFLFEPTPIVKRPAPPTIPSKIDLNQMDSTVFITDIYKGEGLQDVPKGTVKKIRIFSYQYSYRGIGGHQYFGVESCWDARRIIGEVPVFQDGSAIFKVPANTPISIQPLDEKGRALQLMRSWFVAMPGEIVSCVGCHEPQNTVSPSVATIARTKLPVPPEPFYGPERPVTYEGEVQPVLDKYCIGCHNGDDPDGELPNFADKSKGPMHFSNSYHALARFVRRPGPESDVHMLKPLDYHTSTSELFQKLEKGHHGVELDEESWRKLHLWADLNVPYYGTWVEAAEAHRGKGNSNLLEVNQRYVELKEMYANIALDYEADSYFTEKHPQLVQYVQPKELPPIDDSAPQVANWPFDASTARKMQKEGVDSIRKTIRLSDEVSFDLVRIPAGRFVMGDAEGDRDERPRCEVVIEKPFWMLDKEVSNALYACFDPSHDSRYIDQWNKDHTTPGYPANRPDQPVIRINWNQARAFCDWIGKKLDKTVRLPSEAQWEWAARAGTDSPMWYGSCDTDFSSFENLSDESTRLFVVAGVNPQPVPHRDWQAWIPRAVGVNDGQMIAEKRGAYAPNPWGLYDMHGSVSEWTASDYRSYPFGNDRETTDSGLLKVVRGGSWNDRPKISRSGTRKYYSSWQKVHNVGFRFIIEDE